MDMETTIGNHFKGKQAGAVGMSPKGMVQTQSPRSAKTNVAGQTTQEKGHGRH